MIQLQTNTTLSYFNKRDIGFNYDNNIMSFRKRRYEDYNIHQVLDCFIKNHIPNTVQFNNLFNNLVELDLSYNLLTIFPMQLSDLINLKHLNLSCNKLNHFPIELNNFILLESLNLSRNQIQTEFPISLCINLTNLKCLKLNENQITSIPQQFNNLINLETLILGNSTGGNQIKHIPNNILSKLYKLKILDLSNNLLTELPYDIGFKASKLKYLYLNNNQLNVLPKTIGLLSNLSCLDLSNNNLSYLPIEIVDLELLTSLNLSNNSLCVIPADIANFMKRTCLALSGNPMTHGANNLSNIGDFSNNNHIINSYTNSYFNSGINTPNNLNDNISPTQLVERLNQLSLNLKTNSNNTPITSPPICLSPKPYDYKPMIPTLKEMASRVILLNNLHLNCNRLPYSILKSLKKGARPCGYCNKPYVSEFIESVELRYLQGHPSLPTSVTYCTERCKQSSISNTPKNYNINNRNNSFNNAINYTFKNSSSNSNLSSPFNSTPRSWKPYSYNSSKLKPAIPSPTVSSPLVPVKDLNMVEKLNDW